MCASVFSRNFVVFINGFPTQDIFIKRDLKQGDLLAYFHFILMAKGFNGLVDKDVELELFSCFRADSSNLVVSHLQYADDTLIMD